MKIAFVHCRIMPGGALEVLKDLIVEQKNKYPHTQIRIFTLISDRKTLDDIPVITVFPGWLNTLFTTRLDYRNLIVFAPFLMKILSHKIQKFKPDEIHISSFAIAKNVSVQTLHCNVSLYLHSPMQYIRSHYDEYTHKLKGRKQRLFKRVAPRLRKRDKKFTQFDEIYANSHYTAKLAKEIYGIEAIVKYPKVNMPNLQSEIGNLQSYYIYTGRLVKFVKEVDKIIELFNHTKDPLIIIGNGPDEAYLKSLAHPNIIFIDRIEDPKERFKIMAQAKGFINLTKESFGISTAEALFLGVPIFGYNQGATPELVGQDSGALVEKKDLHTLIAKFEEFKSRQRDRQKIAENIKKKLQA